jgi:hypothetical protein
MRTSLICSLTALALLLAIPFHALSQKSEKTKNKEMWHRFSLGGNVGFQFGSITGIVLSPEIKFRTVDQLYIGAGFSYEYLQINDYYLDWSTKEYVDFKSNVFGGRIFARYYLHSLFDNALGNIFAHVEYEYLTYTRPYVNCGQPPDGSIVDLNGNWYRPGKQMMEFNSIFVGGGYSQSLGGRASLDLMILFNLNDSYNSPYTNPVFRLGFGIGL